MRDDMLDVTSERMRRGKDASALRRYKRHRDKQELEKFGDTFSAQKESMSGFKQYGWNSAKDRSNWRKGPIHNFLKKNVGRDWNDVYSEICQSIDRRAGSLYNVLGWSDSFEDYLVTKANDLEVVDGIPCHKNYPHSLYGFYVHPETNQLQYAQHKKWHSWRPRKSPSVEVEENKFVVKINGYYYFLFTNPVPDKAKGYSDVVLDKTNASRYRSYWHTTQDRDKKPLMTLYGKHVACYLKQSMSKKEIKAFHEKHGDVMDLNIDDVLKERY